MNVHPVLSFESERRLESVLGRGSGSSVFSKALEVRFPNFKLYVVQREVCNTLGTASDGFYIKNKVAVHYLLIG